jgi:hypothetical protein
VEATHGADEVTKKEAAFRQINAAIKHFEDKQFECAITLAGAAEGQLVTDEGSQHLWERLKVEVPPEFKNEKEWMSWLNATRDWLKHETPQWGDEWEINEYGAALMIARAITKFHWAYKQITQRWDIFLNQWRKAGFYTESKH